MKLPFGIFEGKFIHISEVNSGKTQVLCPYCKNKLLAKKGRIKRHHFAHDGARCTQHFSANFFDLAGRLPKELSLSVYAAQKLERIDQFYQHLLVQKNAFDRQKKEQQITALKAKLQSFAGKEHAGNIPQIIAQIDRFIQQKIAPFPDFHTLRSINFLEGYTDGKRTCSIDKITADHHEFYYPIVLKPFIDFLHIYHQQANKNKEILDKLSLFEKDFSYFQQFHLYFLEILVDHQKIYKIGLTSRAINTRIKEIEQDLKAFYLSIETKVLFLHQGVAFLEIFFKHKYIEQQLKVGQLTEYFSFSEPTVNLLLKDLNLLKIKNPPNRTTAEWIDWVFFNFSGKIYGYHQKSVYVKGTKFFLNKKEEEALTKTIELASCY